MAYKAREPTPVRVRMCTFSTDQTSYTDREGTTITFTYFTLGSYGENRCTGSFSLTMAEGFYKPDEETGIIEGTFDLQAGDTIPLTNPK